MTDIELDLGLAVPPPPAPVERLTERHMLDRLATKFGAVKAGNGPRYVVAEHVRSQAGFDARRTVDCMVQDLWRSKDHALHGFEVKVSRSDWLTELRDPSKSEEFRRYLDHWWLVAADRAIVRGDLPDGWGLMVAHGKGLRVVTPAPKLLPEPMPATMRAAFVRAAARTAERALTRRVLDTLAGVDSLPKCERWTHGDCNTWAEQDTRYLHEQTAAVARRQPCGPCRLRGAMVPS